VTFTESKFNFINVEINVNSNMRSLIGQISKIKDEKEKKNLIIKWLEELIKLRLV
jgi:hypothetical protein